MHPASRPCGIQNGHNAYHYGKGNIRLAVALPPFNRRRHRCRRRCRRRCLNDEFFHHFLHLLVFFLVLSTRGSIGMHLHFIFSLSLSLSLADFRLQHLRQALLTFEHQTNSLNDLRDRWNLYQNCSWVKTTSSLNLSQIRQELRQKQPMTSKAVKPNSA